MEKKIFVEACLFDGENGQELIDIMYDDRFTKVAINKSKMKIKDKKDAVVERVVAIIQYETPKGKMKEITIHSGMYLVVGERSIKVLDKEKFDKDYNEVV